MRELPDRSPTLGILRNIPTDILDGAPFHGSLLTASKIVPWLRSAEYMSQDVLEDTVRSRSNNDLFDVHNMLISIASKKGNRASESEHFGSVWLSTPTPVRAKSPIHLMDTEINQVFDSDSYYQWRYHFTPLGVSHRVSGYEFIAKTLCTIDTLRFLDTYTEMYATFAGDPILFIGNTNKPMAMFGKRMLGAYVSRTSVKQKAAEILHRVREGQSPITSSIRAIRRSYIMWMPHNEFFSMQTRERVFSLLERYRIQSGLQEEQLEHECRVQALLFMFNKC